MPANTTGTRERNGPWRLPAVPRATMIPMRPLRVLSATGNHLGPISRNNANMFGASSELVRSWHLAYHLAC